MTLVKHHLPEPMTVRVPIDESTHMPLLDLEAPADFNELAVRQHMDISDATETKRWSAKRSTLAKRSSRDRPVRSGSNTSPPSQAR